MSDLKCPYCGFEQEVYHDDDENYKEGVSHKMECYECEKSFVFVTCITADFFPYKADCLNGGKHKWKYSVNVPRWNSKAVCEHCDKRRSMSDKEIRDILGVDDERD